MAGYKCGRDHPAAKSVPSGKGAYPRFGRDTIIPQAKGAPASKTPFDTGASGRDSPSVKSPDQVSLKKGDQFGR